MTIDEAIEILEELHDISHDGKDPDWQGAIQLGIEALKKIQEQRALHIYPAYKLLPGETPKKT